MSDTENSCLKPHLSKHWQLGDCEGEEGAALGMIISYLFIYLFICQLKQHQHFACSLHSFLYS